MIITGPKYQQIAADIAAKIVDGHYRVGEKIYARSSLASQYGVSSETARRAVCVLSHLKIVEATKGSGVIIKSYENAILECTIASLPRTKCPVLHCVHGSKLFLCLYPGYCSPSQVPA